MHNLRLVFVGLLICHVALALESSIVKTPVGTFAGFTENGLVKFLGIRYGTPPVGDLRFMPSSIYVPTNTTGIFQAQSFGASCWQQPPKPTAMSEDCLFLNIFVPSSDSEVPLPVMVWIHGGGFLVGSGADHTVGVLAHDGNVIVVSINYRLGPLGLLSSQDLYTQIGTSGGINSVADQLVALQWVNQYIEYFGGDPNRVTVFGESAGGISSGMLLITPALTVPIQNFVVQSGPIFGLTPLDLKQGFAFANAACLLAGYGNCDLAQMRAVEPQQLMTGLLQAGLTVMQRPANPYGAWLWSIDGLILPELPREMLAKLGSKYQVNGQAVMTGFVSMDGIISPVLNTGVPPLPKSADEYQAYIQAYFGANPNQVTLLNSTFYPLSAFNNDPGLAWAQMNSDACWVCPTIAVNRAVVAQKVPLYTFEFFGAKAPQYLSAHSGDVYFLFNMTMWAEYFNAGWDDTLSMQMQVAWARFATTGKPDLGSGVEWASFNSNDDVMLLQAEKTRLQTNFAVQYHNNACDKFWLDENQVTPSMLLQMCWEYPSPGWPGHNREY
jgi:para-nitrobenzyl esterase